MTQSLAQKMIRLFAPTLAAISLVSCASKESVETEAAVTSASVKPKTSYRSRGPVPQNPNMRMSADISASRAVTVSSGARAHKYIALTFDDGPHPVNTPRLLDILRRRNVKATFYVVGNLVERYPHIAQRIVQEGHEIGNHTWDHPNLKKMSDGQVRQQLDSSREAIVRATGVQPRTMRPPYGSLSSYQRQWIYQDYGYPTVLWDVDPLDWKRPGSSVVASRLINGTRNGSILLAHDLHAGSVSAMPQTIDTLLRKGYQFVTVSQLIAAKGSMPVR